MEDYASFEERSLSIARSFLMSVVVVDDKARLEERSSADSRPLITPRRGGAQTLNTNTEVTVANDDDARHELYAKPMIDRFAENGLVCAVLRPEPDEDFLDKADHATQRSDIVILDWKIDEDFGDKILNLISKIISTDSNEKDRLRLITIYTGENDLLDILSRIEMRLTGFYGSKFVTVDDSNFMIDAGPTRVVIYAKDGGHLPPHLESRQISALDLAEAVIKDFAKMTEGLLANATLGALGELRKVPHRLLNKFSGRLDAAYLNHRALTFPADEARNHFIPLLAEELQSVFEDNEIDSHLDEKAIKQWLDHKYSKGLSLRKSLQIKKELTARSVAEDSVVNGFYAKGGLSLKFGEHKSLSKRLSRLNNSSDSSESDHLSILTKAFSNNDAVLAERCDRDLAMLMTIRSRYNKPAPQLHLGTIVVEEIEEKTSYYLCIQPLCDSARVPSRGIDFLFVKLKKKSSNGGMDLVILDKTEYLDFTVNFRPYEIEKFKFKSAGSCPVVAVSESEFWVFKTKAPENERRSFRWVAALKWPHAQRISMKYATQVSRVGLTESEWTRRQSSSF